ncbi:hypothetical protein HPP92_011290 [Vanilla planifolia]|uniref:Uncharacterized protein n=1 Tax=Vanilla planifolia TaxID=51239 RepID=A0A835R6T2_VANPL|nr:hypothetical protein HPP92_011290 [Vanilla planifolia]
MAQTKPCDGEVGWRRWPSGVKKTERMSDKEKVVRGVFVTDEIRSAETAQAEPPMAGAFERRIRRRIGKQGENDALEGFYASSIYPS